jgi:hypothetical protein
MAMRYIHMVQRLQDSMIEVDALVVIDCYGKKKQYLLGKEKDERNGKEEKQNVENIQCAVRRPCKDSFPLYAPPFILLL